MDQPKKVRIGCLPPQRSNPERFKVRNGTQGVSGKPKGELRKSCWGPVPFMLVFTGGIIRSPGFLGGAKWISSIHSTQRLLNPFNEKPRPSIGLKPWLFEGPTSLELEPPGIKKDESPILRLLTGGCLATLRALSLARPLTKVRAMWGPTSFFLVRGLEGNQSEDRSQSWSARRKQLGWVCGLEGNQKENLSPFFLGGGARF